jgi:hypothetical protein
MSDLQEELVVAVDTLLNSIRGHAAILEMGGDPNETDEDLYLIADEIEERLEELGL